MISASPLLKAFCLGLQFRSMQTADLLAFLAIVIALSAYIATIRLFMIDKMRERSGDERAKIRFKMKILLLADVPMTVSACSLGIYTLFNTSAPWFPWFMKIGICGFVIGGLALIGLHAYNWWKTSFSGEKPSQYLLVQFDPSDHDKCDTWIAEFEKKKSEHKCELEWKFKDDNKAMFIFFKPEDAQKATSFHFTQINTTAALTNAPTTYILTKQTK